MATNNAINTGMPIQVQYGGTGVQTFTSNGTIYFNGTTLASVSPGTAGFVLTSNGAGAPSYQATAGGSMARNFVFMGA